MPSVPFPISSTPGSHPGEGQGRLINCIASQEGDLTYWRRCAGFELFTTLPKGPVRGWIAHNNRLYIAAGDGLFVVDADGAVDERYGRIPGAGPVQFSKNNFVPPHIVFVGEFGALRVSGSVRVMPDGTLPFPNSVNRVGDYLVFTTEDGQIWASSANSLTFDLLSFDRAASDPDGLLTGVVTSGVFYAMGSNTIEPWQDVGATPFPLQRASTVIPVGLLSAYAVAGGQGEWDKPPIFVASDGTVRVLAGFQTEIVSTADVERDIAAADASTLRAHVYQAGGRSYWVLSSPSWSWQFDAGARQWVERVSIGADRWRIGTTCRLGDDWFGADYESGAIYRLSSLILHEAGNPLIFGADSAPVKDFPNRTRIASASFDFTLGHGRQSGADPVETTPYAMLKWSLDGGAHWHGPMHRSLGEQGKYVGAPRVNNLGLASHHGVRLGWRVSDPVDVSFIGATIEGGARK